MNYNGLTISWENKVYSGIFNMGESEKPKFMSPLGSIAFKSFGTSPNEESTISEYSSMSFKLSGKKNHMLASTLCQILIFQLSKFLFEAIKNQFFNKCCGINIVWTSPLFVQGLRFLKIIEEGGGLKIGEGGCQ